MKPLKLIAFILAIIFIAGLFAGCKGSIEEDGSTASPTVKPTSGVSPTEAVPDEPQSMYPVADEEVTISAWGAIPPSMLTYVKDGELNTIGNIKLAEEATNIHVDWTPASMDNGANLLGLLLISDDIPDILTCAERFYAGGRNKLISEEVCIDIMEYAEEWAPDWYALYMSEDLYASSVSTYDGKVAQMFGYKPYIDSGTAIRKDWLDKIGMDVPTTYDELTDVLYAFVTELGASYAAGVSMNGTMGTSTTSWNTGGYNILTSELMNTKLPWQVDENGNVHMSYALEGMYEYFSMIHEWYEKGIVSGDFLTYQTYGDMELARGDCGYAFVNVSFMSDSANESTGIEGYQFVAMPEPVKNAGDTVKMGDLAEGKNNFGASVSADSENIEYALKYLNWFWTEEGSIASNFGVESVTYHYDSAGNMYWDDLIVNNPDGLGLKMAQYVNCGYVGIGYLMDYNVMKISFSNDAQREAQDIWVSNRSDEYVYYGVLTEEEDAIYNEKLSDMCTYIAETYGGYIVGSSSLDDFWTNVEKLYDMGLQAMIDVKQAAYDRYISG